MNTANHHAPIRRILLTLDTAAHSLAAVEAATALAAHLDAELYALFVEDINLLHLAGLPFAREMHLTSATTRRLQNPDMERALRTEATRAQVTLATVAKRLNVRWSFQVTRGQVAAQVHAAALETDLVALTFSSGVPAGLSQFAAMIETVMRGVPCPLLILPPGYGVGVRPPFVVVYDGSPASVRAVRLAAQLALVEAANVTILLASIEPPVLRRLRSEADALLAGTKLIAHYPVLARTDATAIARAVRAATAGTLLMAAESPVFDGDIRHQLLEKLECAALLTR
jgi:nucleotide-binding universal stress UspA family protein